ncbi:group II intron reverse transcriptase/maturase [Clostridium sp. D2Q-14]|uniref:group II intron reverse transcriptase/maturase n=1 Tax=Anaeromonas gelatinilytica TaxID=2683194 RepID=UPI00193BB79C|nr:group II intron reverse transcriptase/maturase [Anaeromonas gelatinilytica]
MNVVRTNNTKDKVRELQIKLYLTAKASKTRRFHALYDKIYRMDILEKAWKNVKVNKGSAGIDEVTIKEIEEIGIDNILKEIQEELKIKSYRSKPVLRVEIPKSNGKMRPLGVPTVKDRIIQASTKIVIEPIFEANFKECSYGFRPKRNQHMALETIRKACNNKGIWVLDADIKGCFDNINHEKLMKLIERRISDRRMLKLINKWLKAGIMKDGIIEANEIGSPQGGVISPLLSNIYLNYMDTLWEKHFSHLGKLVRFADDFVIVCKNYKSVKHARRAIEEIMRRLELTFSEEKTKTVSLWEGKDGFDFLGFHNRMIKHKNNRGYEYYQLVQWLSDKAKKRIQETVRNFLRRSTYKFNLKDMIKGINRKIIGWQNYYGISRYDKLIQIDKYIIMRFIMWFNGKRQTYKRRGYYEIAKMINGMGLKRLAIR